jgi:hypothetical protein
MDPDQVILKFAGPVIEVLFLFEVREQSVEEKEARTLAWHWTTQACQEMDLPYHASKGGFPTLVRSSDYQDSFWISQLEIVAHQGRMFLDELIGQRKIERPTGLNGLGLVGHLWVAKTKPSSPETFDMLKASHVELHFAVEGTDSDIKKVLMMIAELV